MALPTLNAANGLSKPIAQQTEPDSQGNEGDTSITRWNHLSKPVAQQTEPDSQGNEGDTSITRWNHLSKPVAQQTEPDSQGNEGDTSIIHWNRLSKPIAQLMEQVSQGISVCTEGDAASITHLSVSLKQYLQYYQAVEGPLTDYESGPDDGEPVEGPLTDYEGSDDDEQRAFYGDLSDVGTSDSEEQRAFYGDMGDMGTSDNEEQRAFYGDLSDISDDAFYGDLSDAGDGEQMLLCDDLTDMSISDEDATASASIAPIVQRTKAEKKAARKRAHLIRKRAIRKGKRKQQQEEAGTDMKRKTKKRRAEARKDAFKVNLDMSSDAPHTKSGWLGLPNEGQDGLPTKPVSKDGLVKQYGLTIIPWDGRRPHLILDREGLVVGALAGRPWDMDWDGVHDAAYEALHSAASRLSYRQKEVTNRRGSFPTLAYGISFGGGQTEPGYLQQGSNHKEEELELLLKNKAIQRLCGFASCAFNAYSERNYLYMKDTVKTIKSKLNIGKDYESKLGVFPCCSFNLGPQTASLPHRDMGNLAHSWCSIAAVGQFNPELGGHLVLWDFGIAIEFPPGSTILIPSALFMHSNASVQEGETRLDWAILN
ncbi:hypothetical protein JOM56_011472 [Amanita muscaria]